MRVQLDAPDINTHDSTSSTTNRGQHGSDASPAAPAPLPRSQLLCSVRGLLRKTGPGIIVGDRVVVGGIDWANGRGAVESVVPRTNCLQDPTIANVDMALAVFALATPPVSQYLPSVMLIHASDAQHACWAHSHN